MAMRAMPLEAMARGSVVALSPVVALSSVVAPHPAFSYGCRDHLLPGASRRPLR